MFFQVYLNTIESKRDEKYTAGNRKCCGNPLGKFLNFKIVFCVAFITKYNCCMYIYFFLFRRHITKHLLSVPREIVSLVFPRISMFH